MPYMTDSPLSQIPQLVPGQPSYLFGRFNFNQSPTKMLITQVAVTSNVVTLTVQVIEGPIPSLTSGALAVNALISVQGTQSAGGALNVNRAAVTAVNISSGGNGTISYAVTTGNITTTADAGMATVDPQEIPDALVNGYSIPLCQQAQPAENNIGSNLLVEVTFPSLPTTATVGLYASMTPWKNKFSAIGSGITVATVAAGSQSTDINTQITLGAYPYLCLYVSSVTGGTNPSIIAKITG